MVKVSKNYARYNDYGNEITIIRKNDGIIQYYDLEANRYLERVIYTKLNKSQLKKLYNKGQRHYIVTDLGNNWYYLNEHHL